MPSDVNRPFNQQHLMMIPSSVDCLGTELSLSNNRHQPLPNVGSASMSTYNLYKSVIFYNTDLKKFTVRWEKSSQTAEDFFSQMTDVVQMRSSQQNSNGNLPWKPMRQDCVLLRRNVYI